MRSTHLFLASGSNWDLTATTSTNESDHAQSNGHADIGLLCRRNFEVSLLVVSPASWSQAFGLAEVVNDGAPNVVVSYLK